MPHTLLGPLDVSDTTLQAMVAAQVGSPTAEVVTREVEEVDYAVPSITTAGRWWVSGRARAAGEEWHYRFFVKHVRAWSRSPFFAHVPEHQREVAAANVPWRTEGLVYRSPLASALPAGLVMPIARRVHDVDDTSTAIWLDAVPAVSATWAAEQSARAAYLLGRLAASPAVSAYRDIGAFPFRVRMYAEGRVALQIMPLLRSDIWSHPALRAFDEVRPRLLDSLDRLPAYAAELDALPVLTGHGDACPNNLLVTADAPDGFTLIDFGFWGPFSVGFDLGQLLVGDVTIGRQPASRLAEVEAAIVPAYVEGLRAEGCDLPESVVRRAHALQVYLFSGLSALPFEMIDLLPPEALAAVAAERAELCRFTLDLVDATG